MNTTEAIVLAGGLGTRLQSVMPDLPKCMAPVKGKPFLTHVLNYLGNQQISKVILSVGYRKDQIIDYFGTSYRSLILEYAIEDEPLGTGGAIKHAIVHCKQESVFVLNGDTYFIPDLSSMEKLHFQTKADISIAIKFMTDSSRYGLVMNDQQGRITDFREKYPASGSGWINGGIYLVNKKTIFDFPEEKFSIENELFRKSCSTLHLQAFQADVPFLDIGIPDDYAKAQELNLTAGKL